MKTLKWILLSLLLPFAAKAQQNDWENQRVVSINKEPYHVNVLPFQDKNSALKCDLKESSFYKLLSGTWKINYVDQVEKAPAGFYEPNYDVSAWKDVKVPGSAELQGFGMPIFQNVTYPFDAKNPPYIGHDYRPVASYRTDFELPANWDGRDIFINFNGAESAFYLWINGQKVGYSENSYCNAGFNITSFIKPGKNVLALQIYRFSDGSYLEDQDFWRLSGIFRDVFLYSTPKVAIADYYVVTDLDNEYKNADLKINFSLRNNLKMVPTKKKTPVPTYHLQLIMIDAAGKEIFSETTKTIEFNSDGKAGLDFQKQVISPAKWNAEFPNLYKLLIELVDDKGNVLENLSTKVGFREVEIKKGVLMVNGVRVMIRGVNRHEHEPSTGRYVSHESMLQDILLMKQYNINAVRTCHYTNDPEWYNLCDEYGIYLCAEANLESHGYWDRFSKDPTWDLAFLDRAAGNLQPNKNHASIIQWSLGNESGFGPNHVKMSEYCKKNDPTRPVHYNPADLDKSVDIISPMYPSVEAYRDIAIKNPDRPVIMCEYAHGMGNSCGNLKEYWEPTYTIPNAQGGYIWDWVDQGFFTKDKNDKTFIANSGEMNDSRSDPFIGFDGVVLADRTVQPELEEYKYMIQPVYLKAVDLATGKLQITNRYEVQDLNDLTCSWSLMENATILQSGNIDLKSIAAGSTTDLVIPFTKPTVKDGKEYWLNLSFNLKNNTNWAKAGHQVAWEQFKVPFTNQPVIFTWDFKDKSLTTTKDNSGLTVKNDKFSVLFDQKGVLQNYTVAGKILLKQGPFVNLYRAPTDNDEKWWGQNTPADKWRQFGLDKLKVKDLPAIKVEKKNGFIEVSVNQIVYSDSLADILQNYTVYNIYPGGEIIVNNNVRFHSLSSLLSGAGLARIGVQMVVPQSFEKLQWYGNGPWENYIDRNTASKVNLYSSTVSEQFFPYSRPQACGNKTGVRWVSLTENSGDGIAIHGLPLFEATALHYRESDMDHKSISEVTPQPDIFLSIDYRQEGLGGGSCGPDTREEYKIPVGNVSYSFKISPVNSTSKLMEAYTESPFVAVPEIMPKANGITEKQMISIGCNTLGAEIHYTTDGSEPTLKSPIYKSPFQIKTKTRVNAKAFKKGLIESLTANTDFELLNTLYKGPSVKFGQQPDSIAINLESYKLLGIFIDDDDNNNAWDHTDLLNTRFVLADGKVVYLSDLKPKSATQGYAELTRDKTIEHNPLHVAGKEYTKGLGSHSPAEIWYEIPAGSVQFITLFGIDDESQDSGSRLASVRLMGIRK